MVTRNVVQTIDLHESLGAEGNRRKVVVTADSVDQKSVNDVAVQRRLHQASREQIFRYS